VFAHPARRRFHLNAAGRLAERGLARVYRLRDRPEQAAALVYVLEFGDRRYYYSMGIRAGASGSPGLTVLGHTILAGAADGLHEFDLLRGEHEFKLRFASEVVHDVHHRVVRVGPGAAVRVAGSWVRSRVRAESDT
jgi:CelD/BcsL family acetyltransferase involved in cellulose biosynthesis